MGFRKAAPKQSALKMAIYGKAGSGKTFTALLIAEGIAAWLGKRIAFIDTERGTDFYAREVPERKVHPQAWDFDALYTRSLTEATKEARALDPEVYGVIVVDSWTALWEATKEAYRGKRTSLGGIPINAWGRVKAPYKAFERWLLNSPFHVIICGREGNEFESDDAGEMVHVGTKMKAEGETPYEPGILLRMRPERSQSGATTYACLAEKDRTGLLAGRVIEWPTFENIAKPMLELLGTEQGQVDDVHTTATKDAEALSVADAEQQDHTERVVTEYTAKFQLCKTDADVARLNDGITPKLKATLTTEGVDALKQAFHAACKRVGIDSAADLKAAVAKYLETDGKGKGSKKGGSK